MLIRRCVARICEIVCWQCFVQDDVLWDASWRASWDCQSPGSNCGSQPQEIWHKHRWRGGIRHLKLSLPALIEAVSEFMSCRADVALKKESKLVDVPGRYLDHDLLEGGALAKHGRSVATEFVAQKGIARIEQVVDGEAHIFFVMLKSLWARNENEDGYQQRAQVEVPVEKAEALVGFMLSTTVAEARRWLPRLGLAEPVDVHHLSGVLSKYAVCSLGPMSCRSWRLAGPPPEAGTVASLHYCITCWSCKTYMCSGACEHTYGSLLMEKYVDLSQPWLKERGVRKKKRQPSQRKVPAVPKAKAKAGAQSPWKGLTKEDRIAALRALYPR